MGNFAENVKLGKRVRLLHIDEKRYSCPLVEMANHRVGASCHFAAEPLHEYNDCANGNVADFTFV